MKYIVRFLVVLISLDQCSQIENVKYQQSKKEKSANIRALENQHKSAQLDENSA